MKIIELLRGTTLKEDDLLPDPMAMPSATAGTPSLARPGATVSYTGDPAGTASTHSGMLRPQPMALPRPDVTVSYDGQHDLVSDPAALATTGVPQPAVPPTTLARPSATVPYR